MRTKALNDNQKRSRDYGDSDGITSYRDWLLERHADRLYFQPNVISLTEHKARLAIRAWQARAAAPPSGSLPLAGRGFFERLREWWQVVGP